MLTFGDAASTNIAGRQLVLVPGLSEGDDVVWVCGESAAPDGVELVIEDHEQYTDVESKYLPTSCRSRGPGAAALDSREAGGEA